MAKVTMEDAKRVTERLVHTLDPLAVILFGSVSKEGKGDDLDILVVAEGSQEKLGEINDEIRLLLKPFYRAFPIDVLVTSPELLKESFYQGSPFLRLIQREGRSLYMKGALKEWIKQAEEELAIGKYLLKGGFYRGACFHSQQAVEKIIKAALLEKGWELERIHSIQRLSVIAEEYHISTGLKDEDMVFLDSIYRGRYPAEEGLLPLGEPAEEEAKRAVLIAEIVTDKILPNLKD